MNDEQIRHYERKLTFEIDSWDLKVALDSAENVIVLDVRSKDAFDRSRIPGARNLPHHTMSPETTRGLDKAALLVTYCDGIGCNASTKGALAMTRLGFRVKELIGGLDWWQRDGHAIERGAATADRSCGCG